MAHTSLTRALRSAENGGDQLAGAAAEEIERLWKLRPGCKHVPMKAALDSSVWCIRCAGYMGEAN